MPAAVEAAMLEAHRAGLSVIPLGANKAPTVKWKQYVDAQPDVLDVSRWAHTAEGFAMLCGGPQRVQVLDFEAAFVRDWWGHFVVVALEDAGLLATFNSWLEGYTVHTPSGGMHVAVHVGGDGEQPGNTGLAYDEDRKVLAETRGHGGYVAAAPSNGTTHPSGGTWVQHRGSFAEIAWATAEEWQAVCKVIQQFDAVATASETPPEAPPPRALPGGVSLSRIEHSGSWIDGVKLPSVEDVLKNAGWTYSHSDATQNYWLHPNDPRSNQSAAVNANGRLYVYSSNATPVPQSRNKQTYDAVDLIGCYNLGHLPNLAERVEVIRGFRQLSGQHSPQPVNIPVDIPLEPSLWMPDDFWEATPWLSEIRRVAWGNHASPEALFGCALSTFLVSVPSSIRLAATVSGATSPLNLYVTLVGGTGTGKSSILAVSRDLLGVTDDENHRYGFSIRSGEGLPEAVLLPRRKPRPGEIVTSTRRSHIRGAQVVVDELATLGAQNSRLGDTSLSYLITAWTGGKGARVGGFKASGDESFPADMVRICAIFGVQPGVASELFSGRAETQGFPGRLVYFGMDHLGPKLVAGEQVPVTQLGLPTYSLEQAREIGVIDWPLEVQQQIIDWDYLGKTQGRPLIEGHTMLNRSRMGAGIALMDDFAQPELVHWQLASEVEKHSVAQRDRLVAAGRETAEQAVRHAGRMSYLKETAHADAWIEDRARRLAQHVRVAEGAPVAWRAIKDRFNASDRKQLPDIVSYAVSRGWIQQSLEAAGRAYIPGDSRPS